MRTGKPIDPMAEQAAREEDQRARRRAYDEGLAKADADAEASRVAAEQAKKQAEAASA